MQNLGRTINQQNRIELNFIRPDVNRPGNYDFVNSGVWLVDQYKLMGIKWNRLAFSWMLIEPEQGQYNWEPYDRIVDTCQTAGIGRSSAARLTLTLRWKML